MSSVGGCHNASYCWGLWKPFTTMTHSIFGLSKLWSRVKLPTAVVIHSLISLLKHFTAGYPAPTSQWSHETWVLGFSTWLPPLVVWHKDDPCPRQEVHLCCKISRGIVLTFPPLCSSWTGRSPSLSLSRPPLFLTLPWSRKCGPHCARSRRPSCNQLW